MSLENKYLCNCDCFAIKFYFLALSLLLPFTSSMLKLPNVWNVYSFVLVQSAVSVASSNEDSTPTCVYHAVMRGLERLVVSFALSSAESDSLVKLSVDRWVPCIKTISLKNTFENTNFRVILFFASQIIDAKSSESDICPWPASHLYVHRYGPCSFW